MRILLVALLLLSVAIDAAEGDAARLAEFYTRDAEIHVPFRPVIRGRQEIERHWQYVMDQEMTYFKSDIEEIVREGDRALETGQCTIYDRQGNQTFHLRFMTVWKKEDGRWRMYRDMANF